MYRYLTRLLSKLIVINYSGLPKGQQRFEDQTMNTSFKTTVPEEHEAYNDLDETLVWVTQISLSITLNINNVLTTIDFSK